MTKYNGNSYYLILRILQIIFPFGLIGYFLYTINPPIKVINYFLLFFSLFFIYIIFLARKIVTVEFNTHSMRINHLLSGSIKDIPYSKLTKYTCIDGQKGHNQNTIEYISNTSRTKKITVDRIVDSDDFIPFLKWLRGKNKYIDFKVMPADSKLLPAFNKEFRTEK